MTDYITYRGYHPRLDGAMIIADVPGQCAICRKEVNALHGMEKSYPKNADLWVCERCFKEVSKITNCTHTWRIVEVWGWVANRRVCKVCRLIQVADNTIEGTYTSEQHEPLAWKDLNND